MQWMGYIIYIIYMCIPLTQNLQLRAARRNLKYSQRLVLVRQDNKILPFLHRQHSRDAVARALAVPTWCTHAQHRRPHPGRLLLRRVDFALLTRRALVLLLLLVLLPILLLCFLLFPLLSRLLLLFLLRTLLLLCDAYRELRRAPRRHQGAGGAGEALQGAAERDEERISARAEVEALRGVSHC